MSKTHLKAYLKVAIMSCLLSSGVCALAFSQRSYIYSYASKYNLLPPPRRIPRLDSKNLFPRYKVETSIASKRDVLVAKNALKKLILSKASYSLEVNRDECKNIDNIVNIGFVCDELNFTDVNNVDSIVYFFRPEIRSNKLIIYHQGHGGDFRELSKEVVGRFLSEGYDVMAFDMPLFGKNPIPDSLPNRKYKHGSLRFYESSQRHMLSFFLTPVVLGIDYALGMNNYSVVSMVGITAPTF